MREFRKDWIEKWAEYAPIKVVVEDAVTKASYTYSQLNNLSNYLARKFEKMGLKSGDRIAVLSEFRVEYMVLLGAAMKMGYILVPLNYRLSPRELMYMINNCSPRLLITEEKYAEYFKDQDIDKTLIHLPMAELAKDLRDGDVEVHESVSVYIADDHPLFILYTSGTTGFPKGAIYTYKMAFWNATNTQIRLDIRSSDHTLVCMPPFHTGGWNVLLLPFLLQGGSFSLLRKFDAAQVLDLIDKEEVTVFMGVPTMLKMMAETPQMDKVTLDALRYFVVGGESMPLPLIEKWKEKGVPIRQGFGLTEVGPNLFSLHHDDAIRKIGSIGTPNFFVRAKLVKEDGTEAKLEEAGELWLKGPVTTPGYWQNEEATLEAFEDGWFKTGDILYRDAEGYFYVKDRIKNMYISGGENVYPLEVEKFLQGHPSINEVAIIGVADEKWGEVGKAIVVLKENCSEEDLFNYCKGQLAKFKVPKYFLIVEELPKTETGKVDRKKLLELYS
ncbi:MAG: o-succinylbenzoate--CoA ligase [Cyclobacteriaceae bacterium]